jgi:hypothetical protein
MVWEELYSERDATTVEGWDRRSAARAEDLEDAGGAMDLERSKTEIKIDNPLTPQQMLSIASAHAEFEIISMLVERLNLDARECIASLPHIFSDLMRCPSANRSIALDIINKHILGYGECGDSYVLMEFIPDDKIVKASGMDFGYIDCRERKFKIKVIRFGLKPEDKHI